MADVIDPGWESEEIPDHNFLYMRVHRSDFDPKGDLNPGAFKNRPTPADGMSTDWDRHAQPEDTKNRARVPEDNAVIRLPVGGVRKLPQQIVKHTPNWELRNRAHTDVFGDKDRRKNPEARLGMLRLAEILIPLEMKAGQ